MINKNISWKHWAIAVSCVMAVGCKLPEQTQTPTVKALPTNYDTDNSTDSNAVSQKVWRDFFTDKHLVDIINTALSDNLDLRIAQQRVQAANAVLLSAKGAMQPIVNGVLNTQFDKFGKYTATGVGNFDTNLSQNINEKQKINEDFTPDLFIGLRSNWEIDLWGKLKSRKYAAINRLLASEQEVKLATTVLVAEVASAYYDLLAVDYELNVIRKNIKLQESALDIMKIQKETGRATELAVQQFRAQLLNTQALEHTAKQQIVITENYLNALVGRYPQKITRDTSFLRQKLPNMVQTGFSSEVLNNRPDIRSAVLEMEAAKADVEAARKAFFPSLTLSPQVGFNSFSGATWFDPKSLVYGVLGGVSAPLLNKKGLKAEHQMATAKANESVYNYQKSLINGFSEVVTNLNNIKNAQAYFSTKEKELNELNKSVTTARELYLSGYANYLEIITAQKGALEAELALASSKRNLFISAIHLYRSLGGGWQ